MNGHLIPSAAERGVRVTTCVKPDDAVADRARAYAAELAVPYAKRRNVTAASIFRETGATRLLVVFPERLALYDAQTGVEYAFHPNLAMIRALNLRRGWRDQFADATELTEGDEILDCTLGFAGEATLAAMLTGESGRVVGLESVPELAVVTRAGVAEFPLNPKSLRAALRRVQVVAADHREYLAAAPARSFDVVYFDPFFDDRLPGSENSVSPLAVFGDRSPLCEQAVLDARRVARRRVVIKAPRTADLPAAVAAVVTKSISGRKSRVAYHIIENVTNVLNDD